MGRGSHYPAARAVEGGCERQNLEASTILVFGEGSSMYHGRAEAGRVTKFIDASKERTWFSELTAGDSAETPPKEQWVN
jgi:hypothetical protein